MPPDNDDQPGETRRQRAERKRALAGSLWLQGLSYREIATSGDFGNPGNAWRLVQEFLEHTPDPDTVANQRKIENLRLDAIWRVTYPQAASGDTAAARVLVDVVRARRALNGLDKPTVLQLEGPGDPQQHHRGPSLGELLPADQFADVHTIRLQALAIHRALPPATSNGQAS